jgi:hypothetical protein
VADQLQGAAAVTGFKNFVKTLAIKDFGYLATKEGFVVNHQGTSHKLDSGERKKVAKQFVSHQQCRKTEMITPACIAGRLLLS